MPNVNREIAVSHPCIHSKQNVPFNYLKTKPNHKKDYNEHENSSTYETKYTQSKDIRIPYIQKIKTT